MITNDIVETDDLQKFRSANLTLIRYCRHTGNMIQDFKEYVCEGHQLKHILE